MRVVVLILFSGLLFVSLSYKKPIEDKGNKRNWIYGNFDLLEKRKVDIKHLGDVQNGLKFQGKFITKKPRRELKMLR